MNLLLEIGAEEIPDWMLAGAIVNPRVLDPAHPSARLIRRQSIIMRRMGSVTPPPAQVVDVVAPPAPETVSPPADSPSDSPPEDDSAARPLPPEESVTDPKAIPQ